ncbi:hypothetical protein HDU76_013289 [Blyttiomyces sp. JEL0837]|nr:hypothetical protein HDU76_013289 [Blyttiomyces sp. JEL0837]
MTIAKRPRESKTATVGSTKLSQTTNGGTQKTKTARPPKLCWVKPFQADYYAFTKEELRRLVKTLDRFSHNHQDGSSSQSFEIQSHKFTYTANDVEMTGIEYISMEPPTKKMKRQQVGTPDFVNDQPQIKL